MAKKYQAPIKVAPYVKGGNYEGSLKNMADFQNALTSSTLEILYPQALQFASREPPSIDMPKLQERPAGATPGVIRTQDILNKKYPGFDVTKNTYIKPDYTPSPTGYQMAGSDYSKGKYTSPQFQKSDYNKANYAGSNYYNAPDFLNSQFQKSDYNKANYAGSNYYNAPESVRSKFLGTEDVNLDIRNHPAFKAFEEQLRFETGKQEDALADKMAARGVLSSGATKEAYGELSAAGDRAIASEAGRIASPILQQIMLSKAIDDPRRLSALEERNDVRGYTSALEEAQRKTGYSVDDAAKRTAFDLAEAARLSGYGEREAGRQTEFDLRETVRKMLLVAQEAQRKTGYSVDDAAKRTAFDLAEAARLSGYDEREAGRQTGFDVGDASRKTAFDLSEAGRKTAFDLGKSVRETDYNKNIFSIGRDNAVRRSAYDDAQALRRMGADEDQIARIMADVNTQRAEDQQTQNLDAQTIAEKFAREEQYNKEKASYLARRYKIKQDLKLGDLNYVNSLLTGKQIKGSGILQSLMNKEIEGDKIKSAENLQKATNWGNILNLIGQAGMTQYGSGDDRQRSVFLSYTGRKIFGSPQDAGIAIAISNYCR